MQHSFWHKIPIVRLLLAFSTGIGTSMFYVIHQWVALSIVFVFFAMLLLFPVVLKAYQQRWLSGLASILLFYWLGIFTHTFQNQLSYPSHFIYVPHPQKYAVMVNEEPAEKASSFKMKALVLECTDSFGVLHQTTGNLILYIGKAQLPKPPEYGDVLMLDANVVREVEQPKNPNEFDYKRYLAFNQIFHQAYVRPNQISFSGLNTGSFILKQVFAIQHYFKQTLREYVKGSAEVGVAQALLYGYDDEIDQATMSAYANTGTLHVLAVSGMHVGLIFVILGKLLFFMNKNKRLLLLKRIIILLFLWIYSVLCGLSPSILRATVMFSFMILAQILERRSNIYNTLAASCFVLLCYDTNMLANVGFQLSYMAVIGIVFIQPLIEKWWQPPNQFFKQVWSITSVSIAAQLATLPLGILYFHQFPNCFLFSNLLIIPLTTLIIYLTIGLLVFSWWPLAAALIGFIVQQLIVFTNWLVSYVEQIPYSYTNGLQIEILQSILLYVIMLCLIFYFIHRFTYLFKLAMAAIFSFLFINIIVNYANQRQKKLVVYCISNSNVIQLIDGLQATLLIDSAVRYDKQKFKFHLQQHIWSSGIQKTDTFSNEISWELIEASGVKVLLSAESKGNLPVGTDVLVMRNDLSIEQINYLQPKLIVIGSKIKRYKSEAIKDFCRKSNIRFHDVQNSGAYELSL